MARFGEYKFEYRCTTGIGGRVVHPNIIDQSGFLLWEMTIDEALAKFPTLVDDFRSEYHVSMEVAYPPGYNLQPMAEWMRNEQQGAWDVELSTQSSGGVDPCERDWLATFYFEDDDAAMRFKLTFG